MFPGSNFFDFFQVMTWFLSISCSFKWKTCQMTLHKEHLVKTLRQLHLLFKNHCGFFEKTNIFSKTRKNTRYVFEKCWHPQQLVTSSNATYTKRCIIHWCITIKSFLLVAFMIPQLRRGRGIRVLPVLRKPKQSGISRVKYCKFKLLYCLCLYNI